MKKRILCGLLAVCLLLALCGCGASGSMTVTDAAKGVVQVYSEITLSNQDEPNCYVGSGFGIGTIGKATDMFITNRHVVTDENADGSLTWAQRVYILTDENAITLTYRGVDLYGDGDLYYTDDLPDIYDPNYNRMVECKVVYVDDTYDFAILKASSVIEDRVALELADSAETAGVGDQVYALGYPAASDRTSSNTGWVNSGNTYPYYFGDEEGNIYEIDLDVYTESFSYSGRVSDVTVTSGNLSRFTAMASENDSKAIQHDATVNGGNSGGPLVTANGLVLGVNTWGGTESESLNYALYIDYVREALDEEGIPYNIHALNLPLIIGVIVAAVVVIAVIVVVIVLVVRSSKKKKAGQQEPVPAGASAPPPAQPAPQPAPAPAPVTPGDTGLRLQGVSGTFAGHRYALAGTVRIGRDPDQCQLCYPGQVQGISRTHCELTVSDGVVYLRDLGSTYGTFLGSGQQLAANQPVRLQVGDSFFLASADQTFVISRTGGQ